jgi:UDP-2,3-diacylglucosamine pyrophosphatase LpxH
MAENITLEFILDGISYLETKKELKKVLKAVKERLTEFPKRTNVALAEGNSDEMIRVNKEKFDYSGVSVKDLPKAEKWYMATQPFWS